MKIQHGLVVVHRDINLKLTKKISLLVFKVWKILCKLQVEKGQ